MRPPHLDWTDFKLAAAVAGGNLLALLLSRQRGFRHRTTTIVAGVATAYFATEPVLSWAGTTYQQDGWPYVIAGVLALLADRILRRAMDIIDTFEVPWPWLKK